MPVSQNSSRTSRRRQSALLMRYSLSPERYKRRVTETSGAASGSFPEALSNRSVTSAKLSGLRPPEPLKITSSISPPRNDLADCSPNTHLKASTTLDLPQPLGPTKQV